MVVGMLPQVVLDFHKYTLCEDRGSNQPSGTSFDVVCCRQAEEAIEAVREGMKEERPFAVVFLDVCMPPGPDGIWAAEQIRRLDPHTQIVLMTGNSEVDPLEVVERAPPPEKLLYVRKPFHPQEVRQFASALSAKWEAERKLERIHAQLESRVEERTRQLQDAYEDLKKLDSMKDEFLSSVSHELRTPLTSIRSFSEILLRYDEVDTQDRQEFLEIINAESERLTRLINDLLEAQESHVLSKLETRLMKHDLIIIDEVGFVPFSQKGAQMLFTFVSQKYLRGSLIVTSNLVFADWTQVLEDPRLTSALLDRITHRCHILEFSGDSFRFRQSLQRQTQSTTAASQDAAQSSSSTEAS